MAYLTLRSTKSFTKRYGFMLNVNGLLAMFNYLNNSFVFNKLVNTLIKSNERSEDSSIGLGDFFRKK